MRISYASCLITRGPETMHHSTKAMLAFLAVTGTGTVFRPTVAHATPILQQRCAFDSLDPITAKLRLEWARACGTRINIISPTAPTLPARAFLTGLVSNNGGIPLWEYIETDDVWGKNSYSGDTASVNQMFVQNQWRVGPTDATTAAGGFQKWTRQNQLLLNRPPYPTFGNNADMSHSTPL